MRAKHADRLAGLDQQRFVALESSQFIDDGVEGLPVARRSAGAAIDDEIVGPFSDLGIEIVHQHPQRSFLRPSLARELSAPWRANGTNANCHHMKCRVAGTVVGDRKIRP